MQRYHFGRISLIQLIPVSTPRTAGMSGRTCAETFAIIGVVFSVANLVYYFPLLCLWVIILTSTKCS
jgi:hypothetical protein